MKILGIEFGSTRIKSVLIDENGAVLALGTYDWENRLVDGLWSYELDRSRCRPSWQTRRSSPNSTALCRATSRDCVRWKA